MAGEKKLTRKQQVFISEYLKCFNATEAAKRAGYSERTAGVIGHENLKKPEIEAEINTRLAEVHMSAREALKLQADIARGDLGAFLDSRDVIDLTTARQTGMTKLIKKLKQKTVTIIGKKEDDQDKEITEIEIELYPADAAQERIMRHLGLFKDSLKIEGGLEIITKRIGVDMNKV